MSFIKFRVALSLSNVISFLFAFYSRNKYDQMMKLRFKTQFIPPIKGINRNVLKNK